MIDLLKFKKIKKSLDELKQQKNYLKSEIDKLILKSGEQQNRYNDCLRARVIISDSSQKTQQQLESVISSIGTKMIRAIFDKPYEYKAEYVIAHNKSACNLFLELDGERLEILQDNGGGLCDIISFANRIAFWKIDSKKRRNVMICDESFKYLHSPMYQERLSELLGTLSRDFKIQLLLVSDQSNLKGDREFAVKNGVVEVVEE